MKSNKTIIYILFGCIMGLSLLVLGYFLTETSTEKPTLFSFNNPSNTIVKDGSQTKLLSYSIIKPIRVRKPYLIVGNDSLEFKNDTIQSTVFQVPVKVGVWKNYWSALIGESNQSDENIRWESVRSKWQYFIGSDLTVFSKIKGWNYLSDEAKICHSLIHQIDQNPKQVIFIKNNLIEKSPEVSSIRIEPNANLFVTSSQKLNPNLAEIKTYKWLLPSLLFLCSLLGILLVKRLKNLENTKIEEVISERMEEEQTTKSTTDEELIIEPTQLEKEELVNQYINNFITRYGDFYQKIEELSEFPKDEVSKQKIKQQLIEMGLHAHSFARAYSLNRLNRPQKEPNIMLIQENFTIKDLSENDYKVYSENPYETNKRYRFLRAILVEMNIGLLDGALLHDTYLPEKFL